jgi:hypothetical protein
VEGLLGGFRLSTGIVCNTLPYLHASMLCK